MIPQSYEDLPKPSYIIVVAGYPRSGNTWVARLIGDILNSPVGGYKNANPICAEGMGRDGRYYVTQLHAKPAPVGINAEAITDDRNINVPGLKGEHIIHIIRDPRDIAISAMHYWELSSLGCAIHAMGNGLHPFGGYGPWDRYVDSWNALLDTHQESITQVHYKVLAAVPITTCQVLTEWIGVAIPNDKLLKSIERQSFEKKKEQIGRDGDGRPYGKSIQLKHMRKGAVGDWKNHFTRENGRLMEDCFGDSLRYYGYETSDDWWEELPE